MNYLTCLDLLWLKRDLSYKLALYVLDGSGSRKEKLSSLFSSWHKYISQTDLPFSQSKRITVQSSGLLELHKLIRECGVNNNLSPGTILGQHMQSWFSLCVQWDQRCSDTMLGEYSSVSSGNTIHTISKTLPNFVHLSNQRSSGHKEKKLGLRLAESRQNT